MKNIKVMAHGMKKSEKDRCYSDNLVKGNVIIKGNNVIESGRSQKRY